VPGVVGPEVTLEAAVVLVLGVLLLVLAAAPILAIAALVRVSRLEKRLDALATRAPGAEATGTAFRRSSPVAPSVPAPPPPPSPAAASRPAAHDIPPAETGPPLASVPVVPPAPQEPAPPEGPRASAGGTDFVASVGPRILVGAGGLAVVAFLGFFVRYAWENNWVGPAGRVFVGAVVSLGLVALGLRLLGRRYRPLGQGLAAAGFAGLYVSAYAAHGVYSLVPRGLAGAVMGAVTLCAVAVADNLGTRLLAALAGVGAYLVPVLLSTGEDRAVSLFAYLLLLGAGALWLDRRRAWGETLPLALVGTALLYAAWFGAHFRPERFTVAAVGLILLTALFVLGTRGSSSTVLIPATALVACGGASVLFADRVDRPMSLLLLLLTQWALAVVLRPRWPRAEATGLALGALATLAWFDRWFRPERASEALVLGLVVAGVAVAVLAVRGLLQREALRVSDAVTQIVAAGLAWLFLDRVLSVIRPDLLGPGAVALAALQLALGLAARRQGREQLLWARVTLALSALFLTLAIAVQLGLFGITLAWAGEALVLLWLGMRHDSTLTRTGGYAVLGLAVGRLLVRHLPLHGGPFTPVVNPSFATWLAVIVAVAAAWWMTAPIRESATLDRVVGRVLPALGIALLFGLLSIETGDFFAMRARQARAAGDSAGALLARRQSGLALSVLWTVFATGLLASGLGLRSRGLFYAAYGLFGVTALKVVLLDLATLPTLYRMFSFLALGVLLLAGAWLNLRFRERLAATEDHP
jgi:uncharacterized membrane protein